MLSILFKRAIQAAIFVFCYSIMAGCTIAGDNLNIKNDYDFPIFLQYFDKYADAKNAIKVIGKVPAHSTVFFEHGAGRNGFDLDDTNVLDEQENVLERLSSTGKNAKQRSAGCMKANSTWDVTVAPKASANGTVAQTSSGR